MKDNILHYNVDTDQHQAILNKPMAVHDMFKDYKDRLLITDDKGAIKMLELGDFKESLPYQCIREPHPRLQRLHVPLNDPRERQGILHQPEQPSAHY